MFRMTCVVTVGDFRPFNISSCNWKRSMDALSDSAEIAIPAICRLEGHKYSSDVAMLRKDEPERVATALLIKEGMPVTIKCGYDGRNVVRFKGFVTRVNFTIPVVIECEGYSYQLRRKTINKTYANTTLKEILNDLVEGTSIKLSDRIPDVAINKAAFPQFTGVQVLEWFKEKMLQSVYFLFDELYVGLRYTNGLGKEVKHRLNWNVIKDNDLKYKQLEVANINYVLEQRDQSGHKKKIYGVRAGDERVLKLFGIDVHSEYARKIREDIEKQKDQRGYEGRLTCFLEPVCDLNMVTDIIDSKYKEREGKYVIEGVDGSFSNAGGRQFISIGRKVSQPKPGQ